MSSSKPKKVHYERGTKGGKSSHHHRSSRDSGVGSSSASDRASLGTSPYDESPFNYQQIEDQRRNVRALQEALDAANEKIRHLDADHAQLNVLLAESNKENRSLKRERVELLNKVDELKGDLQDERKISERYRREASPRTGSAPAASASASRGERRTTPPRREPADPRIHHRDQERSRDERRTSYIPTAPQPPANAMPNPFTPRSPISTRAPPVSVSYSPTTVTYAQAPVAYTTAPAYSSSPPSTSSASEQFPNDGRYHPYPL